MNTTINDQRIKIMGEWDGEPIWRYMTTAEVLAEELQKLEKAYPIKITINAN